MYLPTQMTMLTAVHWGPARMSQAKANRLPGSQSHGWSAKVQIAGDNSIDGRTDGRR